MHDRHAPLKTRRRVSRPVVPWYNETIDQAKRERKKALVKRGKQHLQAQHLAANSTHLPAKKQTEGVQEGNIGKMHLSAIVTRGNGYERRRTSEEELFV